jgi:hypothetical protein
VFIFSGDCLKIDGSLDYFIISRTGTSLRPICHKTAVVQREHNIRRHRECKQAS